MPVSRRKFLRIAGAGLGGAVTLPFTCGIAKAKSKLDHDNNASMLYDSTLCVGCRACQLACKKRSSLPSETDPSGLYEAPKDLSAKTWTLIKLYQGNEGTSFVKHQCMHCLEPACVSVCPVAALEKVATGPVIYHAERCIGCRYCMAACPFSIPKTEWEKSLPLIQKCDFCADRQANGLAPACSSACPTGALIYGPRGKLLEISHSRLNSTPGYIQHVYGENEVGGTSMLYISNITPMALGFPELGNTPLPAIDWPYMQAVPIVVGAVITLSTAIYMHTHRKEVKEMDQKLAEEGAI